MWLTKISIRNPYFATVIMLALMFVGMMAYKDIPVELSPDVKFPVVLVMTPYAGASPSAVEADVSRPIEEAVNSINGIREIKSTSYNGFSWVIIFFNIGVNPKVVVQDVRDKVGGVRLVKGTETPIISTYDPNQEPIIDLAISGDNLPLRELTDWAKNTLKNRLQIIPGVGEVEIDGGVERQIRVNIQPYELQALGLSVGEVTKAITNANNNYSTGDVSTVNGKVSVILNGKLQSVKDFANIIIANRNSVPIKLSDVALVEDSNDEFNSLSLLNGKRAIGINIKTISKANVIEVSKQVKITLQDLEKSMPAGIKIQITKDNANFIIDSLNEVKETIFEGALLTILIVFIFLHTWRSTVITGLTLPIALLGTFFVMHLLNFTLNTISLMALSLSIGLLIDDAIVVRENIVRHLRMGKDHVTAALDGTNEIGLAVFATTLTVIAVFLPIGTMQGIMGQYFMQFGLTIVVAVAISLFVSFTLDPMLSSIWHEPKDGGWLAKSAIGKWLYKFEQWFDQLILFYEKVIIWALNHRKTVLSVTFMLFIGSFGLVKFIGAEFEPKQDEGEYTINFKTATGSSLEYSEAKVNEVSGLLKKEIKEIKYITANIKQTSGEGFNKASLYINIGKKNSRNRSDKEITEQTRKIIKQIAGVEMQAVGGWSSPIQVNIQGQSDVTLKLIGDDLMAKFSKIDGATDLQNSIEKSSPALNVKFDRELAADLGINLNDIGDTLSVLFAGNKVTKWEDPILGQNYDVVIRIPETLRDQSILHELKIPGNKTNYNGQSSPTMISLATIASVESDIIAQNIKKINLKRSATITGNILGNDTQKIFSQIQKTINEYNFPAGYTASMGGEAENISKELPFVFNALIMGILFIYMILIAQFRSFVLPVVIMVSLPLAFIGAFGALFIFNGTLNLFSVIGIIMLMGLVAKNGILLVDFINEQLKQGIEITTAIINAGKTRLRPIIMTSLAMIFGMIPLAMKSTGKESMAYVIIGGLISSTILTLIVIPVLYSLFIRKHNFNKENHHAQSNSH